MVALFSVLSIFGGTCLACHAPRMTCEKHAELVSGLMLVAGLGMIGAQLPIFR